MKIKLLIAYLIIGGLAEIPLVYLCGYGMHIHEVWYGAPTFFVAFVLAMINILGLIQGVIYLPVFLEKGKTNA